MSVVIRPEDGQADSLKALLLAVRKVAGDEPVTVGYGGVVVSRAVARKFLNARTTLEDSADTTGRTVDNTRTPLLTRHPGDTPGTVPDDGTSIGGLTPEGEFPGGAPGVPADAQTTAAGQAAAGDSVPDGTGGPSGAESTPTPAPAKPAKKTAAAQQRASRTTRSNP